MEGYEKQYTDARDQAWEEDILFFAGKYLTEHSYLSNTNFFTHYQPDLSGKVEFEYTNAAFDPGKRQDFIDGVQELLVSIPGRTDEQIQCELLRLVAALGDVHSSYWWYSELFLPLWYQPFFRDDGVEYRVVRVRRGSERLMLAKLVSYNGIPVEEVVERVSAYVAHESDRALPFQLASAIEITALTDKSILAAAGIIDADDRNLMVVLQTEEGLVEERMAFRSVEEILKKGLTLHPMEQEENLRYRSDEPYWWTMIDEKTVYVRLTTMVDSYGYSIDNLISEIRAVIRDSESSVKVVIDFRGNGGGYVHESALQGLINTVSWYGTDGVYILIDGNCFSAGVMAPYYLRQAIEGSVLVGTPTGQGLWFPANSSEYELPNHGTGFCIGDDIICVDREWKGDALEPDVTVYQTLEDYEAMTDSVIAWVLAD